MYDINGDVSFDDYAIEVDDDYIFQDFDVVEQHKYEIDNEERKDTDIQFE